MFNNAHRPVSMRLTLLVRHNYLLDTNLQDYLSLIHNIVPLNTINHRQAQYFDNLSVTTCLVTGFKFSCFFFFILLHFSHLP